MPTLDLAAFIVAHCYSRSPEKGAKAEEAVAELLDFSTFPKWVFNARAALYGYAQACGATEAPGFDPAWKPAGCVEVSDAGCRQTGGCPMSVNELGHVDSRFESC